MDSIQSLSIFPGAASPRAGFQEPSGTRHLKPDSPGFTTKLSLSIALMCLLSLGNVSAAAVTTDQLLAKGDTTILSCPLDRDCSRPASVSNVTQLAQLASKSVSSLGLNTSNLFINGIAVGFAAGNKEANSPNTATEINSHLPAPMAVVGDYYSLTWDTLDMKGLDYHLAEIKKLEGGPVWCLAILPQMGLQAFTWEMAHTIALKMKEINHQGITVWLKFAYEMNGPWNAWGGQPQLFRSVWRMLAQLVKSKTNNTLMLWSPNVMFGKGVDEVIGGYTPYWPGAAYVDIAGLSLYHWGIGPERLNHIPQPDEFIPRVAPFSQMYGKGYGKDIIISETAAAYTYDRGTKAPVGKDREIDIKLLWLQLVVGNAVKRAIPSLVAVIWFEIVKDENATGDTPIRTEDFRLIVGNQNVRKLALKFFRHALG